MSVIDCVTDSVIKVLSVGPPGGGAPNVLWTSRCNKLWKCEPSQYIKVFDAHADTLLDSIHCPFADPLFWGYNPLVGKVYVGGQDCVAVMSEDGDSLLGLVTNRGNPFWFWNPTNGCAYWSRGGWPDSSLYLDVRTGEDDTLTLTSIEAPLHARNQLAFFVEGVDSARNLLIATQDTTTGFPEFASFPVVIDCARETVLSWFPLGWQDCTAVINQSYHKVYYLNLDWNQIRALDYLSGAFRDIFPGGGDLKYFGGAYSAATNRLYVFVDLSNTVDWMVVIDGATDSILRRIELPDGVGWLCFNPALHKLFINGNRGNAIPTDSSVQVYVESLPGGIPSQARPQSSVAFSIVPNPARGSFTCVGPGRVDRVAFYSSAGRRIRECAPASNTVPLSGIASGVYFVKARVGTIEFIRKLVVR
jgi:hypothetical protein